MTTHSLVILHFQLTWGSQVRIWGSQVRLHRFLALSLPESCGLSILRIEDSYRHVIGYATFSIVTTRTKKFNRCVFTSRLCPTGGLQIDDLI